MLLNYLNHGEESAQLEEGIGTGFTQPGKVYRSESRRQNQAHQVNGGKVQQDIVSFYFTNVPHDISYSSLRQSFVVCGIMEDVYLARKRNVNGGAFGFVRYCKVRDVEKLLKALNNVWFRDWRVVAKVASFDRFGKSQAVGGKRVEGDKIIEGEKSKSEGAKNTEGVAFCSANVQVVELATPKSSTESLIKTESPINQRMKRQKSRSEQMAPEIIEALPCEAKVYIIEIV